jgi:hypothetical protein
MIEEYPLKGGDFTMNKRELFVMYLSEDLKRAEDNYNNWKDSYEYYLQLQTKVSRELITYYRRESEVAYELWQYKVKCYSKVLKNNNPISK